MKPVVQLIKIKHGSHLYGTNTETSDTDYKGVHIPSGEAIILGRPEEVIDRGIIAKNGTKNTCEAVDYQSYSVQKFLGMLMKGDTVATEILFAPPPTPEEIWNGAGAFDDRWLYVQQVGKMLLNRECKGFVGYCVRQAAKYGIKGSRMAAVKSVLEFLKGRQRGDRLASIEVDLHNWSTGKDHISWENIPTPQGGELWHLDVCDRKMPMTASIGAALDVYTKVWENYGERARAAMTNEGVDWKAVSHAVRVAGQAIELLDTGKITFPRPNADFLRNIKLGKYDYEKISPLLEELVEQVQLSSEVSTLPEKSNTALADRAVMTLYLEQTRD
jgi:hypothetical protein